MLNHDEVLKKLQTSGYLDALKSFEDEEYILLLQATDLSKVGLHTQEDNYLLVVYKPENKEKNQKGKFHLYEIDHCDIIGAGAEGTIRRGKDLRTGEFVLIKMTFNKKSYSAWKLAYQKLNDHPGFVKTHAIGKVCRSEGAGWFYTLKCDEIIALQIMEEIKNVFNIYQLSETADRWSESEINQFIDVYINNYEAFVKNKIVRWDSNGKNVLIDSNYSPIFCDFNGLGLTENPLHEGRVYARAVEVFRYIYWEVQKRQSGLYKTDNKFSQITGDLRTFLAKPENAKISRKAVNKLFREAVKKSEAQREKVNRKAQVGWPNERSKSVKKRVFECDRDTKDAAITNTCNSEPIFLGTPMFEARQLEADPKMLSQTSDASSRYSKGSWHHLLDFGTFFAMGIYVRFPSLSSPFSARSVSIVASIQSSQLSTESVQTGTSMSTITSEPMIILKSATSYGVHFTPPTKAEKQATTIERDLVVPPKEPTCRAEDAPNNRGFKPPQTSWHDHLFFWLTISASVEKCMPWHTLRDITTAERDMLETVKGVLVAQQKQLDIQKTWLKKHRILELRVEEVIRVSKELLLLRNEIDKIILLNKSSTQILKGIQSRLTSVKNQNKVLIAGSESVSLGKIVKQIANKAYTFMTGEKTQSPTLAQIGKVRNKAMKKIGIQRNRLEKRAVKTGRDLTLIVSGPTSTLAVLKPGSIDEQLALGFNDPILFGFDRIRQRQDNLNLVAGSSAHQQQPTYRSTGLLSTPP